MNSRKVGIAVPLLVFVLMISVAGSANRVPNTFENNSVAYPEDEERKSAPLAIGAGGEILEVVEVQEVLGRTLIVYKEPIQGQYYYLEIPGEPLQTTAPAKNWPSQMREVTIKSANQD